MLLHFDYQLFDAQYGMQYSIGINQGLGMQASANIGGLIVNAVRQSYEKDKPSFSDRF